MDTLTLLDHDADAAARIVDVPVWQEMSDSFMAYALSVITARAIPDVRDGLKPVQRRVLWSMLQMRLRPRAPRTANRRVWWATPWAATTPTATPPSTTPSCAWAKTSPAWSPSSTPQGNFGSLDDPPAASRYTECRLAAAAMDIVGDIDENTVDMVATYDGEGLEPSVMPRSAAQPDHQRRHRHSGGDGDHDVLAQPRRGRRRHRSGHELAPQGPRRRAVGGAAGTRLLRRGDRHIRRRAALRLRDRHRQDPGPCPHGGRTQNADPARSSSPSSPPNVGAEKIVSTVCELAAAGRLPGVRGATDLSDIDGTRLRIDLDGTVTVPSVTAELCRLTPLETSISVNNVVLDGGVPVLLGFVDLCQRYIDHRMEVVVRRSQHRLDAAQKRLHLVEGLLTAVDNLDEVVRIIRKSKDPATARAALMKRFALSTEQAEHILDMTLRRLTALEKLRLDQERAAPAQAGG